MPMEFPKIEWRVKWMDRCDRASFPYRNNRDRGNRRRMKYWDRRMQYCASRAVGMTHREAVDNWRQEQIDRAAEREEQDASARNEENHRKTC